MKYPKKGKKRPKPNLKSMQYVTTENAIDLAEAKDWQMDMWIDSKGKVIKTEIRELKPTKTKGKWMQFKLGRKYTEFIEEQAKNTHKDKQGKKNP